MTIMTKILAGGCFASALLLAQSAHSGTAFQHSGWIAAPGTMPVSLHANRQEGQFDPIAGKPFSGTEIRSSVQTLSDGTRVGKSDSSAYYRDDKGRVRSEGKNIALIFDPAAGFNYQLDLKAKTYTRTSLPSNLHSYSLFTGTAGRGAIVHNRTKNGQPVVDSKTVTEDLPSQAINGVQARGTRITTTIPMGIFGNDREIKVVNERWSSDDLRILVKSVNLDPRFGESTYDLTNVVQGAPNPSLFQVPVDFTQNDGGSHPGAAHETHPPNTVHQK